MKRTILLLVALILAIPALQAQRPEWPPFDPAYPDVHDPVMAEENGTWHLFTTGFGIGHLTSTDRIHWQFAPSPLNPVPQWAMEAVPGYRGHTWAPDIQHVRGQWYLYYSCSTFGKNTSAIGVLTTPTLDPTSPQFGWRDLGMVVRSERDVTDYNAIDPNVILDRRGRPWLTFGSFWDGIQLVRLQKDMHTPVGSPVTIARRRAPRGIAHNDTEPGVEAGNNAIEAPFIVRHGRWYYLFASWDLCCRGLNSNYKTIVGRSRHIDGPYVDRDGRPLAEGGGTIVAQADDRYCGVGHCGVYQFADGWYIVAHAYDRSLNGASKLFLRPLLWIDGWPEIAEDTNTFQAFFQKAE